MKKVMVYVGKDKDQALEAIRENSKSILADYGQSMLVDVENDNNLKTLESRGYRIREINDTPNVQVGSYNVDTTSPAVNISSAENLSMREEHPNSERSHYILHLIGPIHSDWKSKLEQIGVTFYQRLSQDNYYLIGVDNDKLSHLRQNEFVESVVPYYASLKVDPKLVTEEQSTNLGIMSGITPVQPFLKSSKDAELTSTHDDSKLSLDDLKDKNKKVRTEIQKEGNIEIILFEAKDLDQVIASLNEMGGIRIIKAEGNRIVAFADLNLLSKIAEISRVRRVDPHSPAGLLNNVAQQIINSVTLVNNHKLDGKGQIIAIADSGLDKGVNDGTMMADFRGRIIHIFARGRADDASDIHGHGTHVAGSVLGDGSNSNRKICGVAPAAKLVFQSTMGPLPERYLLGIPHDLGNGLFDVARDNGATIHSNSWGSQCRGPGDCPSSGKYDEQSTQADDFAFKNRTFLILFAAGNDGENVNEEDRRVSPPGTAKNVLTVGASENLRPLPDNVLFPNGRSLDFSKEADNKDDVASFSSIGPVETERIKPDIVAPGTWILSTRSTVSVEKDANGNYTHTNAIGYGLPEGPMFGLGNKNLPPVPDGSGSLATGNYMYDSGTSMATPITAGSCALLRQYFMEQLGVTPSAALLKAVIINGAIEVGVGIPHKFQGWGRIDLDNTLFSSGQKNIVFDDSIDNAVGIGDIRKYEFKVSSTAVPLSVTLVWRDPPGPTIQNSIHLRLIHKDIGTIYSSEDINKIRNNVQKIVIKEPKAATYNIEVEGVDVITGIPELGNNANRQDYALIVSNTSSLSLIS
jgi:subtilisin family serine protease